MSGRREVLSRLAGTWEGSGTGSYPGIATFRYFERLVIAHESDWNMLSVLQRTWLDECGAHGKALHLESGIIQARDDGSLVYSCAQDSGRTEVMRGIISAAESVIRIEWVTIAHAHDERLLRMGRTWWLDASSFRYEAYLATVRNPEYQRHLEAIMHRSVPSGPGIPPSQSLRPPGFADV